MPYKRIMIRVINKQFMAKCKSQEPLVVGHKEDLVTSTGKADTIEQ